MGTAQVAEQIGLHHLLVGIERRLIEGTDRTDAGIVDPDVDAPLSELRRRAGQGFHLIAMGDVGGHHQHLATERAALVGGFRQSFGITRRQHQARALPCERLGRGATNATGGAGQHHQGAVEICMGHRRSSLRSSL